MIGKGEQVSRKGKKTGATRNVAGEERKQMWAVESKHGGHPVPGLIRGNTVRGQPGDLYDEIERRGRDERTASGERQYHHRGPLTPISPL